MQIRRYCLYGIMKTSCLFSSKTESVGLLSCVGQVGGKVLLAVGCRGPLWENTRVALCWTQPAPTGPLQGTA